MKIVAISNLGDETVSHVLVASGLSKHYANKIVELLNRSEGMYSPLYYKAVANDHKLNKFEP